VAGVGGFKVVLWSFCRSAVGQLIYQTQLGRGKYGFGRREIRAQFLDCSSQHGIGRIM
jgi:hypothetical protein